MAQPRRLLLAASAAAAALVATIHPGTALAAPSPGGKNARAVSEQVHDRGKATFWLMLKGDADLRGAQRATGTARATEVYRAKRAYADRSQAGVRRLLAD